VSSGTVLKNFTAIFSFGLSGWIAPGYLQYTVENGGGKNMALLQFQHKRPGDFAKKQSPGRGRMDEIFWRGGAAIPAQSAGQRRVWGGNPNK